MRDEGKKSRVIEVYSLTFINLLCTVCSFGIAALLRHVYDANGPLDRNSAITACLLLMLCSALYNILIDSNRDFFKRDNYSEFMAVVKNTVVIMISALVAMFFMLSSKNMSRMVFSVFALINIILTYAVHVFYKKWMLKHYKKNGVGSQVLIITSSDRSMSLMRELKNNIPWNTKLVAICIMDAVKIGYDMKGIPVVANADNLYDVAGKMALDEVLIDLPDYPSDQIKNLVTDLQQMGIVCNCCIHTFQIEGSERTIGSFGNRPVVSYEKTSVDFRRELIKRVIDIAGALVGLAVTAVITPFVALAIKIESPGPVFFAQERIGKNGRRFKIYKFRSMYIDAEERKKELMEKNQMTEQEAFRYIQKNSMDSCTNMVETAQMILLLQAD